MCSRWLTFNARAIEVNSLVFSFLLTLITIDLFRLCKATTFQISPDVGIASTFLTASPGDTIILQAGNYTGLSNCGLMLSISNITIQGQGPTTRIMCSGEQGHGKLQKSIKISYLLV